MKAPGAGGEAGAPSGAEWIDRARPPVPVAFRPWLEKGTAADRDGRPDLEALIEAAEAALERSLEAKDEPRDGAFDLLAADAFVTWAAEAALDADDPPAVLDALVRRLATASPEGHALEGR